jgi:hypothetical protein
MLATWSLVTPSPASGEPVPPAPARLRAAEIDFASLAPLTRTVMQHELGVVLAPAALALSWRRSRPGGETDSDELRVVLLRSTGVGADRGALGSTARQGLVPTIWVYVPNVALTLGLDPEAVVTSLDAQRLVGIALGRVVAHEVVHVLAPEVRHGGTSVMRPAARSPHRGQQALERVRGCPRRQGCAWLATGGFPQTADGRGRRTGIAPLDASLAARSRGDGPPSTRGSTAKGRFDLRQPPAPRAMHRYSKLAVWRHQAGAASPAARPGSARRTARQPRTRGKSSETRTQDAGAYPLLATLAHECRRPGRPRAKVAGAQRRAG